MKENLFRGKKKSDNQWIRGSLISVPEGSFIYNQRIHHILEKDLIFGDLDGTLQAVIPETVGQFIGHRTESGDMFFEGDIVKYAYTEKIMPMVRNLEVPCDAWIIGVVRYNSENTKFEVNAIKQQNHWYGSLPHAFDLQYYNWKVIGNVTDNPDILENSAYEQKEVVSNI